MANVDAAISAEAGSGVETVDVELVYAPTPHQLMHVALQLPSGSTAADALQRSGWRDEIGAEAFDGLKLGLWGRACAPETVLRSRDRLELYRPLQVDPKEARRQRYRRDGVKRAPRS